jgi:CHAT domain/SIR2-like domain
MKPTIQLDVSLSRRTGNDYDVLVQLDDPYQDQFFDPTAGEITIQLEAIEAARRSGAPILDVAKILSDALFSGKKGVVADKLAEARRLAIKNQTSVRFRLILDKGTPALQSLPWESLLDPESTQQDGKAWLCTLRDIYFSRYLGRTRTYDFTLRQKHEVRALVVIANPKAPPGLVMAPIDVDAEADRAKAVLAPFLTTSLFSSTDSPGKVTLRNLITALEDPYDIVYLICHGVFGATDLGVTNANVGTFLYFENAQGLLDRVGGQELVTQIERLPRLPSLMVLSACQTAGSSGIAVGNDHGVLASLGPRLIGAGVPSVIALQGDLRVDTAQKFFSKFFTSLGKDGVIDQAMAQARSEVSGSPDFYVPVLFHRLKSGRLWYASHDVSVSGDGIKWSTLLKHIHAGDGMALIGSGLLEPYVGPQVEIARRLAHKYNMTEQDCRADDLTWVAQYISAITSPVIFERDLRSEYVGQLLREYGGVIPSLLDGQTRDSLLNNDQIHKQLPMMLNKVHEYRCKRYLLEPYRALASVPFKAYLTTNADSLLEKELIRSKRSPTLWQGGKIEKPRVKFKDVKQPQMHPLLAYLYGTFEEEDSLVVTEQDYFDQLTNAAQMKSNLAGEINTLIVKSALVFVGFRLHEWDFRILFRRLKLPEGWKKHENYAHVAVQIDPGNMAAFRNATELKYYLKQCFTSQLDIFEGSVEQFVAELTQRYRSAYPNSGV